LEYCRERLISDGTLPSMFVVHTKARLLVVPTAWSNDEEKDRCYLTVKMLCIAEAAIGLSFMGEAWYVDAPTRRDGETKAEFDERLEAAGANAETNEQRREVVVVQTSYRDKTGAKTGLHRVREIVRGPDGKPTGLTQVANTRDDNKPGGCGGPAHELLPDEPPSQEERLAAAEILRQFNVLIEASQ
jgi:hypothetical protein